MHVNSDELNIQSGQEHAVILELWSLAIILFVCMMLSTQGQVVYYVYAVVIHEEITTFWPGLEYLCEIMSYM